MRRLMTLTTALSLLVLAAPAWAAGLIAGRVAEPVHVTRALVGSDSFVTTEDGQKFRLDGNSTNVLVATHLLAPETLVVVPAAQPTAAAVPMALVLARPVARTTTPVPVVVLGPGGAAVASVSTNVLTAEVVTLAALRPGTSIVVTGAAPVAVAASPATERLVTLRGGQSVVIADSLGRTTTIVGEVDFDPAALRAGEYVTVVQREGGRYYLSRATPPRTEVAMIPAGTVAQVDQATRVITLHDGRRIDARGGASTIFLVREQPVDVSTLRTGTIVVIDPGSALALEAPSAIPADVVLSGRIVTVPARTR